MSTDGCRAPNGASVKASGWWSLVKVKDTEVCEHEERRMVFWCVQVLHPLT